MQELRITQVAFSIEQVKALAKSMPLMPNINGLHLKDTNLTDEGFSILLRSIDEYIRSFKSISVRGTDNKFGQKSYPYMKKILQRRVPFQLTALELEGIKIQPFYPAKLLALVQRYGLLEKLSLANVKLDIDAFKSLCQYMNKNYSLKDLNLRHLNFPVREFAMILPFIAENRKLQYLNISGNTLVDNNADAYDLFNLDALNAAYLGTAKAGDDSKKAGGAKKPPNPKDAAPQEKPEKKKKPLKRRNLQKVTQEYVLEFIKKFILENQSLIQFDLTNTGLDEWGIVELVQLI